MEAAVASILQPLLPSAEAFTKRDETDARIELLPVKGTNYLLGKLRKKQANLGGDMSFLPVAACICNKKLCPDNDNELFE